ncbi:hypothetical protein [Amycolatopsis sp.]|uniref:hypothetical protein n=1 Tax=Amycolatopsis sp. TaxID=37632 RepID=UPI002E02AA62|nr:hypothetical protein [Amycolatopsis sp.]
MSTKDLTVSGTGRRRPGRWTALAATFLITVAGAVSSPLAPVAHADAAGGAGDFIPLPAAPVVLDTRVGTGGVTGERGPASTSSFPVLGVGGIPATGVGSVLIRLATLAPTASTFLTMFPEGTTRPTPTHLSAGATENISVAAVVKVGASGKISVYNSAGKTDLTAEVQGYFKSTQGSTGGGFFPVTPTRLIDTRSALGTTKATIAAGATRTVTITGALVPAGSSAAFVNLLVPSAPEQGWLTASPAGGTARPIMNYEKGSTQTAASLALPADGKVTFTNKGASAVNLVVNVEGYFSKSPLAGAGLRQVSGRLVNTRNVGSGLPIPANGTLDVQVGGTFGLPTRGIAGAVLSLTGTPEKTGYIKAWPLGETESTLSIQDFVTAGVWRTNTMVLKPGTDGKIRIRNSTAGTIHLIADLQGWFADPLPAAPVRPDTRMSALQLAPVVGAGAGAIEYAYVDNSGRVVHGTQTNVDNFGSVVWTVLSGNEAFTGQPTITQLADGRIQITAQYSDGDIWAISQTAAGAKTWKAWEDLGGSMASPPVAAKLSTGTVTQFAVDADGKLWVFAQTGSVPFWRNLGDQDLTATLSVTPVRDGLRVFALNGAGTVKTILYYNDGSLSPWTDLGGTGFSGAPAVVVRPGFLLQAFLHAADGTIVTKVQDAAGAWSADWLPIGSYSDPAQPDAPVAPHAAGAPSAILDSAAGKVVVVVRGTDGEIHHLWETATGSNSWGRWTKSVEATDPAATDPTVMAFANSNGQSRLITFLSSNGTPRFYGQEGSGS